MTGAPAASRWRTKGTIRGLCRPTWDTRTSSIRCATPSFRPIGSRIFGGVDHETGVLRRLWFEGRPAAPPSCHARRGLKRRRNALGYRRRLRQEGRTIMTRIADDFDAIRRRLAELANKPEKLTTITPANSPLHPLGSPTQSPPTQCPPQDRTCRSCGAIQNFIVDRRCWVCPRCGTSSSP
jgi:hypothetical protein